MAIILENIDGKGQELYFKLNSCRLAQDSELSESLAAHNTARAKISKDPLEEGYYSSKAQQRMYLGEIIEISTNLPETNKMGRLIRDNRVVFEGNHLLENDHLNRTMLK